MPPLKFILLFLVSTLLLLFFSLIYQWGQWVSLSIEDGNSLLLFLPNAAYGVIFPAASAALLFAFFDYRKKAISPLAVILTSAVIFAVLFFGFRLTTSMQNEPDSYAFQPFNEKKLHITEDNIIYIDTISKEDSNITNNLVVRSRNSIDREFRYYKSGRLINHEQPSLNTDTNLTINITPSNPVFSDSFKAAGLIETYLRDIGILNAALRDSALKGGLEFILLVAVFTAFLISCLLFRGATVWPLFEFILILAFHRLVYYLFGLFSGETDFISDAFFGGKQLQHMPLFILTGFTLIIFLCGLLIKLTSGKKNS